MTFVFGPKTRFLTVLATLTDIDASFFAAKEFGGNRFSRLRAPESFPGIKVLMRRRRSENSSRFSRIPPPKTKRRGGSGRSKCSYNQRTRRRRRDVTPFHNASCTSKTESRQTRNGNS